MTWGEQVWLMGLWGAPALALLVWTALRRRAKALELLGPLIGAEVGEASRTKARRRLLLLSVSVILTMVALAQPRWGYRWEELKQEGTSVVIVLDTSLSMDAEDVSPSRMARAHREISDLAGMLQGDRVGLVLFAGGAYMQMPLTTDYSALETMVRRSSTASLRAQGSDLGAAIRMATRVVGQGDEADRAMIIISDGEDQSGEAEAAAREAKEAGVHIFAVGIGTADGAPIPLASGGFKKDAAGNMVLSRIEEGPLQRVAEIGSGAYVRSVAGSADMTALYQGEVLGKLKRAEQLSRREKIWLERFQWPLGLAWFLGLLAFVVRGRGGISALVVLAVCLSGSPASASDQVDALTAEQVANPDDLDVAERLGAALFKEGRFNEADRVLRDVADRQQAPSDRARSRYNAGLAAYKAGRLTQALESWQRVLQDHPDHTAAQQNAAAVQAEIQKRMGEEPPPQDGDGEESSEESQQSEDTGGPSEQGSQEPGDDSSENDGIREPEPEEAEPESTEEAPEEDSSESRSESADSPADPTERDTGAAPLSVEEITASEAERMFDSVREGDPRVVVGEGSQGGRDW